MRIVSGYYNFGGVPSLGNERLFCITCKEHTIHKWRQCIHCNTPLSAPKYRRPKPMRQTRKYLVRQTGLVAGLERKD